MSVKLNIYDLKTVCRLCLKFDKNSIPIDIDVWNQLFHCFSILLSDKPNYPNKICVKCFNQLNSSTRFKKQCESSEKNLNKILSQVSTKPIIIEPEIVEQNDQNSRNQNEIVNKNFFTPSRKKHAELTGSKTNISELFINKDTLSDETMSLKNQRANKINEKLSEFATKPIIYQSEILEEEIQNETKETIEKEIIQQASELTELTLQSYQCDKCYEIYESIEKFSNHMETNHSYLPKNKEGNDINTSTHNINQLTSKKRRQNVNMEKRPCHLCNKLVTNIKTHLKFCHQKQNVLHHKCKHCVKIFGARKFLEAHMRNAHKADLLKLCSACGETFSDIHSLNIHMMDVHSFTPKTYICDICEKTFKRKGLYDYHLRMHDLSLMCNFCSKRFLSKSLLKAHVQIHTGT